MEGLVILNAGGLASKLVKLACSLEAMASYVSLVPSSRFFINPSRSASSLAIEASSIAPHECVRVARNRLKKNTWKCCRRGYMTVEGIDRGSDGVFEYE